MWRFNLNGQNDRFFQNLNGTRCEKSEIRNQKTEISFDSNFGELSASGAAAKKSRVGEPGVPGTAGKPVGLPRRAPA